MNFALSVLVILASVWDIRFRRIPNWLVLCGLIAGLLWNASAFGASGVLRWVEGLATGLALYLPFYILRARGAGDVKLLAALGSICGPFYCLWIFLIASLAGGVVAVVAISLRGRVVKTLRNLSFLFGSFVRLQAPWKTNQELDVTSSKSMRMPHAPILAAGVAGLIFLLRFGDLAR